LLPRVGEGVDVLRAVLAERRGLGRGPLGNGAANGALCETSDLQYADPHRTDADSKQGE